jgi:D-serine deaminase-like pyridoxal phosphate-dependent protein
LNLSDPDLENLLTPALLISASAVDENIRTTVRLLANDPGRWRPHVKTAKLDWTIRRLMNHGVTTFKCSTTLELMALMELGAEDVLFAMPLSVATARRVEELASEHSETSTAALAESDYLLDRWPKGVGLTIDLDVGMHRTGLNVDDHASVCSLASAVCEREIPFTGLHAYDGHLRTLSTAKRSLEVHALLDRVVSLVEYLLDRGIPVSRVVTSGTLTFLDAFQHQGLNELSLEHQVSPGTLVYFDGASADALDAKLGFRPAVHVLSRVLSAPAAGRITCDAGHKSISADAGVPTCSVAEFPDLVPQQPSEEHLPIDGEPGRLPPVGDLLELVPRHVCPTVNLYDMAILVDVDSALRLVHVTTRGRETNLV